MLMKHLPMLTVITLLLSIACNQTQPGDQPNTKDSSVTQQILHDTSAAAGTLPSSDTSASQLAPPSPELAKDTIPLLAPDGGPARFGIESGKIVQRYSGTKVGTRITVFDDYGMRENKQDSTIPTTASGKVLPKHTLFIMTPDFYGEYDFRAEYGWKVPNRALDKYLTSEYADQYSLGEMILNGTKARRLADTTLHGYHCRVYQLEHPTYTHTKWVWRGITLFEEQYDPVSKSSYTLETESATFNITVPDSTFDFPKDYKIEDMPPPKPGQLVPVPSKPKEK